MLKKKNTHTLRFSIIKVLIGTCILQLCIMIGVIFLCGTTEQLDANAEQNLKDAVFAQGQKLEERMSGCSELSDVLARVNEITEKYCREDGTRFTEALSDPDMEMKLIQKYTTSILRLLRSTGTTGSFVILNGEDETDEKYSLYFRDLDPQVFSRDDSDILVVAGPGDYLVDAGYTLDSNWRTRLTIDSQSAFYRKPYEAALQYGDTIDANNLGYWSPTFRLMPGDIKIITYSVPLITKDGQVYGVMGIEFSEDYLHSIIDSREIVADVNAGIVLATRETSDSPNLYNMQIVTGSQYQAMLSEDGTFSMESDSNNLFQVMIGDSATNKGSKYALHLYNSNTPFEEEEWSLTGIAHKKKLEKASTDLRWHLLIAAIVALGISIVTAFVYAIHITRPIYRLMEGISGMNDPNAHLPKTYMREFDDLGMEIETRNRAVWQSVNKTANIIRMTGLPLGVFEYDESSERNFCTEKILEFFHIQISDTSWKNNYVDLTEMKAEKERIMECITREPEEKEIFHYELKDQPEKWLRIKRVGTPKHYICTVMDVTDEMSEKQKIKHERDYDVLTDLYNRRAFAREVKKVLREKADTKGVMSIWDLDNLKYINDTYGHDMGDRYISLLANVFKRVERKNVLMSRMSGDEFMMFIYDENPIRICEIMRDAHRAFLAEKICLLDGTKISVSASAGMAIYPTDGSNYSDLARYADFAMYEVKNNEKGAIKLFDREHFVRDYILVQGVGELTRILQEEKVRYVFQPIVDVRTRQIFAYEALLRPESELLKGPNELIRLAESQSKLRQIEVITWSHAVRNYVEQVERNPYVANQRLFLNSIPGQSLLEEEWKYLEERYSAFLPQVVMEVTEIAKTDTAREEQKYQWCREHGIQIALDDYGSGYSNNDVLVSSELDYVKLDMTLVRDIHMIPARQRLVKGIIEYCHENHIKVIAEGVELKKELDEIIHLGTDYVQGYYLARPQANIIDMNEEVAAKFNF